MVFAFDSDQGVTTHIGGNYYVVKERDQDRITIGKFEKRSNNDRIELSRKEFFAFVALEQEISHRLPELNSIVPCYMDKDHQNQLGYLMCPECNPAGTPDVVLNM